MQALELNARVPYATEDELLFLHALEVANVVMLGAGPGVMLLAVRESNRDIESWVIDKDAQALYYTDKHLEGIGLYSHFVESDSAEAAKQFRDDFVDLLIVDADHSYEGVKRDIEAWVTKIAVDGLVFFHDYDADGTVFADKERYPGVRQAVDAFLDNADAFVDELAVGTAIVVRRIM
jgi:hypothetical protein